MARTRLLVLQQFRADREVFLPGQEVPMETAQSWGTGTLDRRIRGKYIRVDVQSDDSPVVKEEKEDGEPKGYTANELEQRTKAELQVLAEGMGLVLDPDKQTKAEMIAAILEA